jgi:hypothetical protein
MKRSILVYAKIPRIINFLVLFFLGMGISAIPFKIVHASGSPVFLVKSGDSIDGKILEEVAGSVTSSRISLNNDGAVAFKAWWEGGEGIFTQDELIVAFGDMIDSHKIVWFSPPSINDSGIVAFIGAVDDNNDGTVDFKGIFTQNKLLVREGDTIDGVLVERLDEFDFPVINATGKVAFVASNQETSLFTQDKVLVSEGVSIDGETIQSIYTPFGTPTYDLNGGEEVVTLGEFKDGDDDIIGVFTATSLLYKKGDILNGMAMPLINLRSPVINDNGDIAVIGGFGESGIIKYWSVLNRNGVLIEDDDVIDGIEVGLIRDIGGMNNSGEVVFRDYHSQHFRWFTQNRFLVDSPVMLDGLEVYLLGKPQINDTGDVVFFGAWDTDPTDNNYDLEGTGIVLVPRNSAPVADAGPDQTVETDINCEVSVTMDGSGSSDPDSTPDTNDDIDSFKWYDGKNLIGSDKTINYSFTLGQHTITLVVTDSYGETDSDEIVITVQDNTPPQISLSVSPDMLWPPNHKMVLITPTIIATDNCDYSPDFELSSITTNENEEASTYDPVFDSTVGDGQTSYDIQIDGDGSIYLRAERSGTGSGRIYTITYASTDESGNSQTADAIVTVPHDQ